MYKFEGWMWRCRFIDSICHVFSNGVAFNRKFFIVLLKWTPLAFLSIYNVLVVGDLVQSWYLILCTSSAPPCWLVYNV